MRNGGTLPGIRQELFIHWLSSQETLQKQRVCSSTLQSLAYCFLLFSHTTTSAPSSAFMDTFACKYTVVEKCGGCYS